MSWMQCALCYEVSYDVDSCPHCWADRMVHLAKGDELAPAPPTPAADIAAAFPGAKIVVLARATALMPFHAGALSDHEVETVAEVGRRFLDHRYATVVTDSEWAVVETAVEAMFRAARKAAA